jgi:hypothetical protein
MSTLLYGLRGPTPPDEANVRSTVTVVQDDAPPSVSEQSPTFNSAAVETDPITEGGLTSHQLASKVTASVQSAPPVGNANADAAMFGIVNAGQSTKGHAPQLEAAGIQGHGTLMVTEGIEPVIEDGHGFSETYFSAGSRPIQSTAGNEMSAAEPADGATRADAQATANRNARAAAQASQYAAFLTAATGI